MALLDLSEIVRVVPGQREVVRGFWNGTLVYAKKFYGSKAKKHYDRDLAGINHLINSGILTPPLLHQDE